MVLVVCSPYHTEDLHQGWLPFKYFTDLSQRTGCLCKFLWFLFAINLARYATSHKPLLAGFSYHTVLNDLSFVTT